MIFNKDTPEEKEIEDGYYWIQLKNKPHEIMRILDNNIASFTNSNIAVDDIQDISYVNLEYTNELIIDFVELNSIIYEVKFGTTDPQIRHMLKGDKLICTLNGFNPPVSAKSTNELKRLNELALKQNELIEEQQEIINNLEADLNGG